MLSSLKQFVKYQPILKAKRQFLPAAMWILKLENDKNRVDGERKYI